MSKLSPDAKSLVAAGRGALRPTDADRARVREALQARLAAGGGPSFHAPLPSAPVASGLGWPALAGLVAAATLIAGVAWQAHSSSADAPVVLLRPALSSFHPALPGSAVEAPSAPAPASAPVSRVAPPGRAAPPRAPSGLAEEVALLSRAETALHGSRFVSALRTLDEYERKFPRGALAQEDVSARVQALCGLGRVADAKQQLRRLASGSPHASRARAACGADRLR